MGIDYSAAIVVGLPKSEFNDIDMLESWKEDEQIESVPPHFDGDDEDYAICGIYYARSASYSPEELKIDLAEIETLKEKFKALTGQEAKVYLSPVGW